MTWRTVSARPTQPTGAGWVNQFRLTPPVQGSILYEICNCHWTAKILSTRVCVMPHWIRQLTLQHCYHIAYRYKVPFRSHPHTPPHTYIYIYVYVCMYVCIYVCIYIRVCMYVCIYLFMYVCMYLYMYVCMCVCMGACMCVCLWVDVCI